MMPDVRDALLKEFKKELITVLTAFGKIKFNESPSYKAYMRAVKSAYDDGLGQEIQLMSKAAGRKFILEEQESLVRKPSFLCVITSTCTVSNFILFCVRKK